MAFNNLPGIIVNTVDGGLVSAAPPQDHSILIIGTCDQGVINQPSQVTNRATAALPFGLNGNLTRSMEECAANSDNVILFRMRSASSPGGHRCRDRYRSDSWLFTELWAGHCDVCHRLQDLVKAGVVAVYYRAIWSIRTILSRPRTTATSLLPAPSRQHGIQIGTGATATFANAITVQAAAVLVGATSTPARA